jgi:heptaprenyl diphosphate synthase
MPVAEDLRHGHKTLPVFYGAEDAAFYESLSKIETMPTHEEVAPLLAFLQTSGALERTQRTVDLYIRRAINRL